MTGMEIAELSILGSFLCFVVLIAIKVWPLLMSGLDDHIEKVKKQIESAEQMKTESTVRLTKANQNSEDVQNEIEEYQRKSKERIARLEEENQRYLRELREKMAVSLSAQLETELSRRRDILVDRLADLIIERLSDKMKDQSDDVVFSKEDLRKLIG